MSPDSPRGQTLDPDLRFFGKVTASISHELNNVLTIIDQVNGLLEDYLSAIEAGCNPGTEQLYKIQQRILLQTERGVRIIRRMNRFAHSVDEPMRDYDLTVMLETIIGICKRFASLKKATLDIHLPEAECTVHGNPFLLQQIVFQALEYTFEVADLSEDIRVSMDPEADTPVIRIEFIAEGEIDHPLWDDVVRQMQAGVGHAERAAPDHEHVAVVLVLDG